MTDIASKSSLLYVETPSFKNGQTIHFHSVVSFTLEIGFSPSVEELGLDLLLHVEPHQILVLVVFMYEVHGMSIPAA